MSIERIQGTDLTYLLAAFDKDGRERRDDPDGLMSERCVQAIRDDGITDVFLASHGWKGDIQSAREQYGLWMKAMADCAPDRAAVRAARAGFKPLIIGFHWPSLPFGDEEFGMGAASFAAPSAAGRGPATLDVAIDDFVAAYADRIADTPAARAAIRTIVTHAMAGGPPPQTLPPEIAAAYQVLNQESEMGASGPGAEPGSDREQFDANRAYKNARSAGGGPGVPAFAGLGLSGILSPLRQLSFWKMKDRARTIGESAGFSLLKNMMSAVPAGKDVRFHLMGHSFGCIVVSSMVKGKTGAGALPRNVHSLTLVQGATSLWGFCDKIPANNEPGYFRDIINSKKVDGAIVTTRSKRDTAVGRLYPVAAGIALQINFAPNELPKYGGLGSFGIQGPGLTLHELAIADASHAYGFERQHIYNFECTSVIKDGTGQSGAHSDIAKPEVAHLMWEAVNVA